MLAVQPLKNLIGPVFFPSQAEDEFLKSGITVIINCFHSITVLYSIIFLTAAGHFRDIKAILRAFVREDRLFRHQLKFRMLKQKRGDLLVVFLAVERAGAVDQRPARFAQRRAMGQDRSLQRDDLVQRVRRQPQQNFRLMPQYTQSAARYVQQHAVKLTPGQLLVRLRGIERPGLNDRRTAALRRFLD